MSGAERALFYLNFIAEVILLGRLIQCRLHQTYRSLFLYWLVQALASLIIFPMDIYGYLYHYVYWVVQTIFVLMAVFVVQDLYRIALSDHPAVSTFGRRSLLVSMSLAAALALSGLSLDSTLPPGHYPPIHRFAIFERSMNFVTLVFLLLISGLLLWFPIKVRRNIIVYISGFVVFTAARAFGILSVNLLTEKATRALSTILLGFTLLSLIIWIIGIQPEGERVIATPGRRSNPETMRRLSRQLDAINSALARFARH